MRIVLLGNAGLASALRRAGHDVLTMGSQGGGFDIQLHHPLAPGRLPELLTKRSFVADALVAADDGALPVVLGLETLPFPTVFYSIDTFSNPWQVPYAWAFDHVLVAQRDFLPLFAEQGHPSDWFPLYSSSSLSAGLIGMSPDEWLAARDIPVAFVGTLQPRNVPRRFPFLQAFRKLQPLVMLQGNFPPVFRRARIVLNQTAAAEVNYRCFEAMGCGAALLTDSVGHGLYELFIEEKHILPPYANDNPVHAAANARHWLEHPHAMAKIALAGMELVAAKHTDDIRAVKLAQLCSHLAENKAPEARLAALPRRRILLASAFGALAAELGPQLSDLATLYHRYCQELSSPF